MREQEWRKHRLWLLLPLPMKGGKKKRTTPSGISWAVGCGGCGGNGRALQDSPDRTPKDDEEDEMQELDIDEDYLIPADTPGLEIPNYLFLSYSVANRERSPNSMTV